MSMASGVPYFQRNRSKVTVSYILCHKDEKHRLQSCFIWNLFLQLTMLFEGKILSSRALVTSLWEVVVLSKDGKCSSLVG